MKIKDVMELPDITLRIKSLIDKNYNGNVSKFSTSLGLKSSSKINRLFKKDKRNDEYPTPSTDIIIMISNAFNVSTDWLLKGENNQNTNNIEINSNKIKGNKNIISNDSSINVSDKDEYMEIIKTQSNQIAQLLKMINVNG